MELSIHHVYVFPKSIISILSVHIAFIIESRRFILLKRKKQQAATLLCLKLGGLACHMSQNTYLFAFNFLDQQLL